MRSARDLLAHLTSLGVDLRFDGENLRYRAKAGVMTPSLIHELRGCQQELKALLARKDTGPELPASEAPALHQENTIPTSSAQRRRWFLHALANRENYVMWRHYRLHGPLDVETLARSLTEVVRRHEALRTAIKDNEGELIQVVMPPRPVELPIVDMSHLSQNERDAELRRIAREAPLQSILFERGELLRALILRLAPQDHVFLLYIDHIAFDGWSGGILMQELSTLYAAFAAGQMSPLVELPAQYADFARWEQAWIRSSAVEPHLAYWREHLRDLKPLALATDHPRPAISRPQGDGLFVTVSARLAKHLYDLAKDKRTTLYVVLLTAFQLLLHRYTGQRRIAVGTPVANRPLREFEMLIGSFSNTVVMCSDFGGDPTFLDLLARVQNQVLETMNHASVPFDRVVEELQPVRDLSRNQMFQVMFRVEEKDAAVPSFQLPDIEIGPADLFDLSVRMDLELVFWPEGEELKGILTYDKHLFSHETAARMMRHFAHLLESIIHSNGHPVSTLPILSDEERRVLVTDWNRTVTDYPRNSSIAELFAKQAARTPDALAVIYGDHSLSYRELDQRSNQLAWRLRALGVGPETPVGIFLERSPEMIVGMLGILKAGGAYLPLDLDYPEDRLELMVSDAQVKVILTERHLAESIRGLGTALLLLDEDHATIARESIETPTPITGGENLAYIIYTSGSTGRPKGVAVTQRGVLRLLIQTDYVMLGIEDRVAQASTATFDAATFEVWGALLNGATLVGIPKAVLLSPASLVQALRGNGITVLFLTTALFNRVVQSVPDAFVTLSTVLFGGEAVEPRWPQLCLERGGPRRLLHVYGPTETTTFASWHLVANVPAGAQTIPIGKPIANTTLHVLDNHLCPIPVGAVGELYVGGDGVARGYIGDAALSAKKFLPDPFSTVPGAKLYRTGDMVRRIADGSIEFIGRVDDQIKVRGFRIELGEIEAVLAQRPDVKECVVVVHEKESDQQLVAYLVVRQSHASNPVDNRALAYDLRASLKHKLPAYMVPAHFEILDTLPLTASGKVDRSALRLRELPTMSAHDDEALPLSDTQEALRAIWRQALGHDRVGIDDKFFDIGGHSLLLMKVRELLHTRMRVDVSIFDLFLYPTIRQMEKRLIALKDTATDPPPATASTHTETTPSAPDDSSIAVIGRSGRFPNARSVAELWAKLAMGAECITFFSVEDAITAGADPALVAHPNYVRAGGILEDIELFDAEFFGYSPREAEIMDPQQRIFLECVQEALEDAGYAGRGYAGRIGVFAGATPSMYLLKNLLTNRTLVQEIGEHALLLANICDFMPTRASYKLHLTGPSISVQTACSTSLVAVHMACLSLLNRECSIALAGGVTVAVPQRLGYLYQEGIPRCPDGHCRAFDASESGMISGSGAGVVVLKRLRDAIADGDSIYAVIRGTAVNNDGANKVGYAAPSVEGQATVIRDALRAARVSADSISYVEAHGTGTPLGDPIEVAALTRAYRFDTARRQYCALGSIKTNVGHLDAAAGVTGLIKVVESLRHRQIPASLHFQKPNPKLGLEQSPFFVNQTLRPWDTGGAARRAGVSSLGIGGTNAHAIIEEAPPQAATTSVRPWQLLILSAKTRSALEAATANLAARLRAAVDSDEDVSLSDVAFTLQVGRQHFEHRRALVCRKLADAAFALAPVDESRVLTRAQDPTDRKIIFMFPGHGSEHVNMARGLYEEEPVFRTEIDRCCEFLQRRCGLDIRAILYPTGSTPEATSVFEQPTNACPILFVVEYALARLWMHWGVMPEAMLCHSMGEYVAACIAGVFSLEDALVIVARRGKLLQRLPAGAMLAVEAPAQQVQALLESSLSVAIISTPSTCVISGPIPDIEQMALRLASLGINCQRTKVPRAGHSSMLDPILEEFQALISGMSLSRPSCPFTSSLTGTWILDEEATSPQYWTRQMRLPVRFVDSAERCLLNSSAIFLEVGPGRSLSSLVRKHPARTSQHVLLQSLRHFGEGPSDTAVVLQTLAQLWLIGVTPTWLNLHSGESRRRIALPTYPFERKRYWLDPQPVTDSRGLDASALDMRMEERTIAALEQHLHSQIHGEPIPDALNHALDALSISHANALLRTRGGLSTGKKTKSELAAQLGLLPRFEKLLLFVVNSLSGAGLATLDGDYIELTDKSAVLTPPAVLAAAQRQALPDFALVIEIADRCLSTYGDVLGGHVQNVAVMHKAEGGSVSGELADSLKPFMDSPRYLRMAREVLFRLMRSARGRPLRVLEIGGGFGRMTWDLVPYLAGMDVEYWFTDVSRTFVLDAEKRALAEGWDFMRFRTFDICTDVSSSGFTPESFDVILAFNVLHVAQNLTQTVDLLDQLLEPGGVLIGIEITMLTMWLVALAGLEEGFWRFDDAFRNYSPMLSHEGWENFFGSRSYHSVQVHPREQSRRRKTDHGLIIVQKNGSPIKRPPVIAPQAANLDNLLHARPDLSADYSPPRNPIEQKLAELWQRTLGIERVGIHDDFFSLGGDSLVALRLLARIRDSFSIKLPGHMLLRAPTIVSLASAIAEAGGVSGSQESPKSSIATRMLEVLQDGKKDWEGLPLFLVPPSGGHLYCYKALMRALGPEPRIYGFVVPGIDGESEPLRQVQELATHYIRVMRAECPHGPFAIAGWSFGGVVAYEMAQLLRASGEREVLVAMIDSVVSGGPHWLQTLDETDMLTAFAIDSGLLPRDALSDTLTMLRSIPPEQRLHLVLERSKVFGMMPPELTAERMLQLSQMFRSNLQALSDYEPAKYDHPLSFFRSSERSNIPAAEALADSANDPDTLGWRRLCQDNLIVHRVAGNHYTMMEPPGIDQICSHLRTMLRQGAARDAASASFVEP